jgi:hypothetical protein
VAQIALEALVGTRSPLGQERGYAVAVPGEVGAASKRAMVATIVHRRHLARSDRGRCPRHPAGAAPERARPA